MTMLLASCRMSAVSSAVTLFTSPCGSPSDFAGAVNGSLVARLPHNLHVSFAGVDGEALMTGLADDVAVSSGSACASGSREPSHVMTALGAGAVERWGALRFGLGRGTTAADIDAAVTQVAACVTRLRAMSPVGVGGGQ